MKEQKKVDVHTHTNTHIHNTNYRLAVFNRVHLCFRIPESCSDIGSVMFIMCSHHLFVSPDRAAVTKSCGNVTEFPLSCCRVINGRRCCARTSLSNYHYSRPCGVTGEISKFYVRSLATSIKIYHII